MTEITLMLAGDVMTGRGIDQILPHPSPPVLYEDFVKSALGYVRLAEEKSGAIPRRVPLSYIWGDALDLLDRRPPDLRIVNLETAVTRSNRPWPKGINYRMHPGNIGCLAAAGIDCCVLANNHVLDWGEAGLLETLDVLAAAGIKTAGAGRNEKQAAAPALLPVEGKGRVVVHAFACPSSGVPAEWAAAPDRPGVNFIDDGDTAALDRFATHIGAEKRPGDVVVCSIHWGPNWGYGIDERHRNLAHRLLQHGADLIHGHSSHHPKAIEIHRGKPILYGCGDFLNDYEGIGLHGDFRSDLSLMYRPVIDAATGTLQSLEMVPFLVRGFQLRHAPRPDAEWLQQELDRECRRFGHAVGIDGRGLSLQLHSPV